MKNYDIKNVSELVSTKIAEKGKKVAYLVPNMFLRIKSGFAKLTAEYGPSPEEVAVAKEQAVAARDAVNDARADQIEAKRDAKIDQYDALRGNNSVEATLKKYVLAKSIKHLENKFNKTIEAPRRLLISTVFLQKLITNSSKRYEAEEVKVEEAKSTTINYQDPVEYYLELDAKRLTLEEELSSVKEQMVNLVRSSGITREMIQEHQGKKLG